MSFQGLKNTILQEFRISFNYLVIVIGVKNVVTNFSFAASTHLFAVFEEEEKLTKDL